MFGILKFKSLTHKQNQILKATVAIMIFVTCIVTASSSDSEQHSNNTAMSVIYWVLNIPIMALMLGCAVMQWIKAFRTGSRYGIALIYTLLMALGIIFVLSIEYHNIFPAIKHSLTTLFS